MMRFRYGWKIRRDKTMAKFDFIIDDDGRAKPVIPVTVFLTTEEEKAAMIEAAKRRTLRLME